MKSHFISYTLIAAIVITGGCVLYRYLTPTSPAAPSVNQQGVTPPQESTTPTQTEGSLTPQEESGQDEGNILITPTITADDSTLEPIVQTPFKLPAAFGRKGGEAFAEMLKEIAARRDREEVLQQLIKAGWITEDQSETLLEWYVSNDGESAQLHLTPVGTLLKGDENVSRFRLGSPSGKPLLIDLLPPTSESSSWTLSGVREEQKDEKLPSVAMDSIHVVERFITAVRQGDMLQARQLITGDDVTDASIAGLCMVFAEGGYHLREQAPIRASFENDGRAAYLVYLTGEEGHRPAFVGLELALLPEKGWMIDAVALDSLLESYEQSAGAEGGRYFPIVKIPQGGDSLVLFFAFDDSRLTPRSLRQLKIVADLLKESQRKLDISGHTDDVGSELYNKELSLQRATAVMKALVDFGVSPGQITMKGMGKTQPRRSYLPDADEQLQEAARAENRRAEIYLDFE